jgi:hypothetical protein
MHFSEIQKILLNAAAVIAWGIAIGITFFAVSKGRKMKAELGVSFKTYIVLVGITEIFYVIGAVMILFAMGINVMHHLAKLEIGQFYQIANGLDWSATRVVSTIGWIGYIMNRSVSFLSPGYLLIYGGKKLPKCIYYSAWTEVGLETGLSTLIFVSLIAG